MKGKEYGQSRIQTTPDSESSNTLWGNTACCKEEQKTVGPHLSEKMFRMKKKEETLVLSRQSSCVNPSFQRSISDILICLTGLCSHILSPDIKKKKSYKD